MDDPQNDKPDCRKGIIERLQLCDYDLEGLPIPGEAVSDVGIGAQLRRGAGSQHRLERRWSDFLAEALKLDRAVGAA